MEKIYSKLVSLYTEVSDRAKDAVCDRMKELGQVRIKTDRDFPFMDVDGKYVSVRAVCMTYDESENDVRVKDPYGLSWSVQYDATASAAMELLYYLEENNYEVVE